MRVNITNIVIPLLIFSIFYVYFLQIVPLTALFGFFLICLFIFYILINKRQLPISIIVLICLACIILLPGLLKIDHGLSKVFYFLLELALVFLAWLCSKKTDLVLKYMKLLVWSFLSLSFAVLVFYFDKPEPFSQLIEGSSQNGIPSYLVLITISYFACSVIIKDSVPLLAILAGCVISFFGEGRGSILVSFLVLAIGFFYVVVRKKNSKSKKFLIYVSFSCIIPALIYYAADAYDMLVTGSKLSVGLSDSHRLNILSDYLSKLSESAYNVIVGRGYTNTIIEQKYNGNPHISFIRLHSFFGLLSLIVVFSPFIFLLKGINTKSLVLAGLAMAALLRAATEPVLFPGLLDFFFFLMFFVYFTKIHCTDY